MSAWGIVGIIVGIVFVLWLIALMKAGEEKDDD